MRKLKREASKLFKRTYNRFLSKAVILLYHRVSDTKNDPQLLCVSPENFKDQLVFLKSNFTILSLNELVTTLDDRKIPDRSVVVTFDDGYADNLHNAKPILESTKTPATIFITSGKLGDKKGFWWDELNCYMLSQNHFYPNSLQLIIEDRTYEWSVKSKKERYLAYSDLIELLRPLPSISRDNTIDQLCTWARLPKNNMAENRILTVSELDDLSKGEFIEIGAHSVTHPLLNQKPLNVLKNEIFESKKTLERIVKRPICFFSYPYYINPKGKSTAANLVKEIGFKCGCANFAMPVTRFSDRYRLPRCIVRNWDSIEFSSRIEKIFTG
ncbi:MAG: polysaccharide deacetylase family protein [Deltaproteobacteria bacterium]|nr:polysaccharide deacetylase family protein [Deltaproteobacteria bacterium]